MFENLTAGSAKGAMKDVGASSSDLWMVPIEDIRVMDGFNVRTHNADYTSHVEALTDSILANGFWRDKPLSGYIAKEDGKNIVYVVDGHTRLMAARAAVAKGAELTALPMVTKPAGTQIEDLVVGLVVSNAGKPLSPIEKAAVCKRLVDYGMEVKVIAARLGFTAGYVNELLILVSAPKKIRNMVEAGSVSASNACDAIKRHGNKAADLLDEKLQIAKAKGKTKVTKTTIKANTNKVLDEGLTYIKEMSGGYELVNMLAHLAHVPREEVEFKLKGKV